MKFTIVHPTARTRPYPSFPSGWLAACWQWYDTCANPEDVEYILAVHHSRIEELWMQLNGTGGFFSQAGHRVPRWGKFSIVTNFERDCVVDQCNAVLKSGYNGEILVGMMDDLYAPKDWDVYVKRAIPDTSQLVALACTPRERMDLYSLPDICTKALRDFVGLIPAEYESMFCDDDWAHSVRKYGRVVDVPLHFDHPHPLTNKRNKWDEIYAVQNRDEAYAKGYEVFKQRRAAGFPRVGGKDAPVIVQPTEKSSTPLREIAICAPCDDVKGHCPEWEISFLDLLGKLSAEGWRVDPRINGSTNVYGTRIIMTDELLACPVEFEYVLWIDDDNPLNGELGLRMIQYLDMRPEVDGIVAWCWVKSVHEKTGEHVWFPSCGEWAENAINMRPLSPEKLFEGMTVKPIECTGFPAFLMRYNVLKTLGRSAFAPIFSTDCILGFSGEDLAFCRKASDAGFKFVVDPAIKVPHLKFRAAEPDFVVHADMPEEQKKVLGKYLEDQNGQPVHISQKAYELMEGRKM